MENPVSSARQGDPYNQAKMAPPGSISNEKVLSTPLSDFVRKRAVLVGINYFGTKEQLRGCINDTGAIKDLLCDNYGFSTDNMKILTDDQNHNPSYMPTRENMIRAMKWLVSDASPNDSLFFYFSGHGSQKLDFDGDEDDGWDETICPVDYARAGTIVDDEIKKILVSPLPPGCRLTAILDCCRSGTVLDLPYQYNSNGESLSTPLITTRNPSQGILYRCLRLFCPGAAPNPKKPSLLTQADVIVISGCKDSQTSADTSERGYGNIGAMTFALIKALALNSHDLSYLQLLEEMRSLLKPKYSQIPQLSSNKLLDMEAKFAI